MQEFLGLKEGGGLDLQIWDLNRVHETERTVFPIPQFFSMCRRRLCHDIKETNSANCNEHFMNTYTINLYYKQDLLAIGDCFFLVYCYLKF